MLSVECQLKSFEIFNSFKDLNSFKDFGSIRLLTKDTIIDVKDFRYINM